MVKEDDYINHIGSTGNWPTSVLPASFGASSIPSRWASSR